MSSRSAKKKKKKNLILLHHINQQLLQRQCQVFYTKKDSKGNKSRVGKLIKEFSVEVLPPLTERELKDLAQRQAMANGTSD